MKPYNPHMHLFYKLKRANAIAITRVLSDPYKERHRQWSHSNAYVTSSNVPARIKHIIMKHEVQNRNFIQLQICGMVKHLISLPNLPPLPTTRQCCTSFLGANTR